jgi:hypothetical protein
LPHQLLLLSMALHAHPAALAEKGLFGLLPLLHPLQGHSGPALLQQLSHPAAAAGPELC